MPNTTLSAIGMFAGFAGLFTGLKPWMILQTRSTVTCNSSYPVLLCMWWEFHVRKHNKPSRAVLSLSVYWFKWIFKTPRRQLHGSKETLRTNVKNWEETQNNGGVWNLTFQQQTLLALLQSCLLNLICVSLSNIVFHSLEFAFDYDAHILYFWPIDQK